MKKSARSLKKHTKKTQKLWNMKGCSKTKRRHLGGKRGGCWWKKGGKRSLMKRGGNCGCGLQLGGKKNQMGGNCGCGLQMGGCSSCLTGGVQMGGSGLLKGGSTVALVGKPWTPEISGWPGVSGKTGETNYFEMNKYHVDPQTSMISERDQQTFMKGGRSKRGGGIVPQDLVNLGRSMVYGMGSAYNTLNGYPAPANPLPYKDQLVNTPSAKALGY
jgi:hypothetical protein